MALPVANPNPPALLSLPSGLSESGTAPGKRWEWAGSIQHWQEIVRAIFPDARPFYPDDWASVKWISGDRLVGEVKPDPKRRSEWVGWVLNPNCLNNE